MILRKRPRFRRQRLPRVRTPLTAIQGFAETLIAGALDDPANRGRFLNIILEHARRLARLTEDLLKLSQMDADRLEIEIHPVKVSQLVESCYETARHRAAEKELTLTLAPGLSENLPDVAGDARRLQEVLQNLLDNAIQYTLPGGKIVLSAVLKNHAWCSLFPTLASAFPPPTSRASSSASIEWTRPALAKLAALASAWHRQASC